MRFVVIRAIHYNATQTNTKKIQQTKTHRWILASHRHGKQNKNRLCWMADVEFFCMIPNGGDIHEDDLIRLSSCVALATYTATSNNLGKRVRSTFEWCIKTINVINKIKRRRRSNRASESENPNMEKKRKRTWISSHLWLTVICFALHPNENAWKHFPCTCLNVALICGLSERSRGKKKRDSQHVCRTHVRSTCSIARQ